MEKDIKIKLNKEEGHILYATLSDVLEECQNEEDIQEEYIETIENIMNKIREELF